MRVTYNGQPLKVQEVVFEMDSVDEAKDLFTGARVVEQELTLNVYYWQLLWLASAIEKQQPKKAKWIRKLAERHNPLRVMGLLPKK